MKKSFITQEQATIIETLKNHFNYSNADILRSNFDPEKIKKLELSPLQNLGVDLLVAALYAGYEVISKKEDTPWYEIGEYVVSLEDDEIVYRVNVILDNDLSAQRVVAIGEPSKLWKYDRINAQSVRPATYEEEFFAKMNRRVWDIRNGDIICYQGGEIFRVNNHMTSMDVRECTTADAIRQIKRRGISGIYPAKALAEPRKEKQQ